MTNNKKCKVCSSLICVRDAYQTALSRFSFLSETEIKIILTHTQGIPYNQFVFHYEDGVQNVDHFFALCERVNDGYPLQYALNNTEFLGLPFYVDERVLIPRGESEELVVAMEKIIQEEALDHPLIADVCTGSGVLGLTLIKRLHRGHVYLSDIASSALEVVAINQEALALKSQSTRLLGASLTPLIEAGIKVDYLIANPPYVNHDDEIDDKVKKFEPHLALFSDHQQVYKDILADLPQVMRTDHIVVMMEINEKEGSLMRSLATRLLGERVDAKIIKDIHGKDRFMLMRYRK